MQTADGGALLEVEALEAGYGDVQVLWGVSFTVHPGELVALVGPNGAGKSTTLRTVSGLIRRGGGTIRFKGERIDGRPPERIASLGIAHVPEGRHMFPELTVEENLEMGAYQPRCRARIPEGLAEVYALFPVLKQKRKQAAGTLSGGQQQMVAIGRGLMADPALLILDEPSLGLAPQIVAEMFALVRQIHARGVAILLVEQNARQSLEVADRGYVMEAGRVVTEGSPKALLASNAPWAAYFGGVGDSLVARSGAHD